MSVQATLSYALAALALVLSYWVGWPAAAMAVSALAAGVATYVIDARRADMLLHLRGDLEAVRKEAAAATQDCSKLRAELINTVRARMGGGL